MLTKTMIVALAMAATMTHALSIEFEGDYEMNTLAQGNKNKNKSKSKNKSSSSSSSSSSKNKNKSGGSNSGNGGNSSKNPTSISDIGYFTKGSDYEKLSADKKMVDLWNAIVPDESNHSVAPQAIRWTEFDNIFKHESWLSYWGPSDELHFKTGRKKIAHQQGLHAKAKYTNLGGHQWSGMFAENSDNVIVRFSQTANLIDASSGLLPSVAVKWLVDGQGSANIVAMPSFNETDSWNFFDSPMSNRVDRFTDATMIATLEAKLSEGS